MTDDRPYRLFAAHEETGHEQRRAFLYKTSREVAALTLIADGYRVLTWDVLRLPEPASPTTGADEREGRLARWGKV